VRAPEGNGCAERFIRTLKEQLLWVRPLDTVEELRLAIHAWLKVYNERWLNERHGHRSPAQVRRDLLASSVAT
jgi:transposase InsO family protein